MYLHRAIVLYKREKDLNEDRQKEENDKLIAAVKAARENAQSLTETNRSVLWDVLDFTRRTYGHSKRIITLTNTYYCDDCQRFAHGTCALVSATA